MTQTATDTKPQTVAASDLPPCFPDILLNLIVALLAPMFISVAGGNVAYARMAAAETVNSYRAGNQSDLIAIAQIIGFGLAALGSLSLSMADDLSVSMTLRLRGNAIALNRAAEQNRRGRKEGSPHDVAPDAASDDLPADQPDGAASLKAAQPAAAAVASPGGNATPPVRYTDPAPAPVVEPRPMEEEKRHQALWAIAMVKEASELTASIPHLPLAERKAASIRAAALSSTASQLLTGPPFNQPGL